MDFFELFSLLLGTALLTSGFFRQRIGDLEQYRAALSLFVAALILYYPVSALFGIGVFLSFVARPLGFVCGVISLRLLCLTLIAHAPAPKDGGENVA